MPVIGAAMAAPVAPAAGATGAADADVSIATADVSPAVFVAAGACAEDTALASAIHKTAFLEASSAELGTCLLGKPCRKGPRGILVNLFTSTRKSTRLPSETAVPRMIS